MARKKTPPEYGESPGPMMVACQWNYTACQSRTKDCGAGQNGLRGMAAGWGGVVEDTHEIITDRASTA
jgi:hypothetical protein